MDLTRRIFLKGAGLGLFALGLPPSFLARAAAAETAKRAKILIVVFQRGGMDGLNVVVPFKDRSYYSLRPSLAIADPASREHGAIDLDGFYGLHPALAPLKPIFDRGHLAVVHATGSPANSRSHFDAQDVLETGLDRPAGSADGWLNRLLQEEKSADPFRAVALTQRVPRILAGKAPALTMTTIEEFRLRDSLMAPELKKLYAGAIDPKLHQSGERLFAAMDVLKRVEGLPAVGEGYPQGAFGTSLKQISRLIKAELGLQIAFTESAGWDTHVRQGAATGQMADRLKELADGLAALYRDLGDRIENVALVTLSEFGRTARENGSGGTDHGHANVMFVMGGKVRGGKVYGRWPGLASEVLYEGRDLALTTDYRSVCSEILGRHMGRRDLTKIFPGFPPSERLNII